MDEEFNVQLDDDSQKEVADNLLRFHKYLVDNDEASIKRDLELLPPLQSWMTSNSSANLVSNAHMESDDSDESEEESPRKPQSKMDVDSDGWTVVGKKR